MTSVDHHRARLRALAQPLPVAVEPLLDCHGLRLAQDIHARVPVPAFDCSAMDGFAVRSADLGSLPCALPVHGEIPAGTDPIAPPSGTAVRIMTGARLPVACDAVIPVELTDARPGAGPLPARVEIREWDGRSHIRRCGEDVRLDELVLPRGTLLDATHLAAAAATGQHELPVRRPAKVLVVTTGDELAPPGRALGCAQIPDSNSVLVAATLTQLGAKLAGIRHVGDSPEALDRVLASAPLEVDLVVTTGGVSVGSHDVLQVWAATSSRAHLQLGPVAMAPGKPQGWGHVDLPGGRVPLVALPGNPVAVHVGLQIFVRAVLDRFADVEDSRRLVTAVAGEDFTTRPGRTRFVDVVLQDGQARPAPGGHGSHRIGTLHQADGLAVVSGPVRTGQGIQVLLTR